MTSIGNYTHDVSAKHHKEQVVQLWNWQLVSSSAVLLVFLWHNQTAKNLSDILLLNRNDKGTSLELHDWGPHLNKARQDVRTFVNEKQFVASLLHVNFKYNYSLNFIYLKKYMCFEHFKVPAGHNAGELAQGHIESMLESYF